MGVFLQGLKILYSDKGSQNSIKELLTGMSLVERFPFLDMLRAARAFFEQ